VNKYFGKCPCFVLVEDENDTIMRVKAVDSSYLVEHRPGQVPVYNASLEADVMISGGMGRRANVFFDKYGIKTATGAGGTV
jgi:predicted Fe-Mo cluster-binding NifX family protein